MLGVLTADSSDFEATFKTENSRFQGRIVIQLLDCSLIYFLNISNLTGYTGVLYLAEVFI